MLLNSVTVKRLNEKTHKHSKRGGQRHDGSSPASFFIAKPKISDDTNGSCNIASIRIQAPKKSSNDAIINTVFNEHELYNHTVKMKAGRKTAVPQLEAKFTSNIEQLKANTSLGKKTEMHTVSTLPAKFIRKKDIRMCHLYL
jgi:hypothetical protein